MSHEQQFEQVIAVVCDMFDVTRDQIMMREGKDRFLLARHACWNACRASTGAGFVELGDFFDRNHSTLVYAWGSGWKKPATLLETRRHVSDVLYQLSPMPALFDRLRDVDPEWLASMREACGHD